jgi:hypothetical protein
LLERYDTCVKYPWLVYLVTLFWWFSSMLPGLLQQLCSILMASGVPADVLTETINTVSEVIRGNSSNQEYFASVMAPSTPPRCVCMMYIEYLSPSKKNYHPPRLLPACQFFWYLIYQIYNSRPPQSSLANTIDMWYLAHRLLHGLQNMSRSSVIKHPWLITLPHVWSISSCSFSFKLKKPNKISQIPNIKCPPHRILPGWVTKHNIKYQRPSPPNIVRLSYDK